MEHLFSSRVQVSRLTVSDGGGVPIYAFDVVPGLEAVPVRLDLNFLRPGKDQPPAAEAGRAPDRVGVMFASMGTDIRAGDRVRAVAGPVDGTFEIRVVPDVATDYASGHHVEVQVVEVTQAFEAAFDSRRTYNAGTYDGSGQYEFGN